MRHRLSRNHRPERDPLLRSIVRTAFLGAFLLMLGCTSWEPVPVNTVPSPSATLRVHLRDGTSVIVRDAVVRTDSIVGIRSGSMPPLPVAVAYSRYKPKSYVQSDVMASPLWVKSGHIPATEGCLLYPRKRTFSP